MLRRERIIKRFILGISVLNSYIRYTGNLNMHDINITAEQFICDVLNLLYDADYMNANSIVRNNSGYDLISRSKKSVVQVSSSNTSQKITHTLRIIEDKVCEYCEWNKRLENIHKQREESPLSYTSIVREEEANLKAKMKEAVDLKGYTIYIMTLQENATEQRKYMGENGLGYSHIDEIKFEKNNILDFSTLINKVSSISEITKEGAKDILTELDEFMDKNSNIFGTREVKPDKVNNKVDSIIKEYADNFTERLFRHRYIKDSQVTLKGIFVNPKMYSKDFQSSDFIKILDYFLWDEIKDRILFIEGDAAIGKTSLVSYLCYHYKEKDEIRKTIFLNCDIVCVRLRELDFSNQNKNIREILLDYLGFSTMEDFKQLFNDCVLILDGADEMSMIEGMHTTGLEELIVSIRKIFNNNKIIITSRPQFIDISKFDARNFGVKSVELLHFDYEMRKQWLQNYEACKEIVSEKTKDYILNIDDKAASGVADTPLALYLLVACDMREELQGNVWALYHEIFNKGIINTEYNENFDNNLEHPIKNHEEILYNIVCNIAFKMFENSNQERYYITSRELDDIIKIMDVDVTIVDWVRKCCVLCAYWKSNGKAGALEFYHNNIRDYFFCEYIYSKLEQLIDIKCDKRFQHFSDMMCNIMQYGYISGTTWEQTFLFIYQKLQYNIIRDEFFLSEIEDLLKDLYSKIIVGYDNFWVYNYGGHNYQKIKYTLFNTLLLIRVLQKGIMIDCDNQKNSFYNTQDQYREISSSNILADWCDMFKHRVTLSDNSVISIGQNCVLDNLNFENRFLQDAKFEDSFFNNTKFNNTKLETIDFSRGTFENTDFSGAILENVKFTNAILKNVDFSNATLKKCNFANADIIEGKFSSTKFEECEFLNQNIIKVNWEDAKIQKCYFKDIEFEESNLNKLKLKNQKIIHMTFTHCKLVKANMDGCTLENFTFNDCTLDGIVLNNTTLYNLKIMKTSCKDAKLNNAFISESQFIDVDFENAVFAQARICKNIWKNIRLYNSDFRNTKIYTEDYIKLKKYSANFKWVVEKKEEFFN